MEQSHEAETLQNDFWSSRTSLNITCTLRRKNRAIIIHPEVGKDPLQTFGPSSIVTNNQDAMSIITT